MDNGESDYNHGFIPDIYINELNFPLIDLGNIQEPLLSEAISFIKGENKFKSIKEKNKYSIFYSSKRSMIDMPLYITPLSK
ncbi:hypothetical protein FACS189451_03530 [Bacteroidia bacterium]|nr:hypothetical protein FACS189451_03530 [Bacteroidia bacterium]